MLSGIDSSSPSPHTYVGLYSMPVIGNLSSCQCWSSGWERWWVTCPLSVVCPTELDTMPELSCLQPSGSSLFPHPPVSFFLFLLHHIFNFSLSFSFYFLLLLIYFFLRFCGFFFSSLFFTTVICCRHGSTLKDMAVYSAFSVFRNGVHLICELLSLYLSLL